MTRRLLPLVALALVALAYAATAQAQISVDGFDNGVAGFANTQSYAYTCSGTLLVAEVEIGGSTLSVITYGGVAPTGTLSNLSGPASYSIYLAWWLNPPTGSNTLSATSAISVGSFVLRNASYNGVGSVDTTGANNLTTYSGASPFTTTALTPAASNSWLVGVMANNAVASSAGTGTYFRAGAGNGDGVFDSNGTVSGASSLQMVGAGAVSWAGLVIVGAPASTPSSSTNMLPLMGVGK